MKYLVDANVLSEPTRPAPDPRALAWIEAHEADLAVDPVILGEMRLGILLLPSGRKRTALERWFQDLVRTLECIPWDAAVGLRWARLVADLRRKGRPLPLLDSLVAATALAHGMTVVTRNVRDFSQAGAKVLDPFA
jgi:hypothetical protein